MKKLLTSVISLGIMLFIAGTALQAQTISVSGNLSSELVSLQWTHHGLNANFKDTWTGDLTGDGHTHIFSSGPLNGETGQVNDIEITFWIFTSDGNLIFDGVGNSIGPFLHVDATLRHGTGIYHNATGQLSSDGIISPDGQESAYTGSINLVP